MRYARLLSITCCHDVLALQPQSNRMNVQRAAGLVYEFTHYIVHTRVVPTATWARTIRDNHVKHHMRNEDYWFAFTTPALDRWLGTAPAPMDVKVSELARSTRGS